MNTSPALQRRAPLLPFSPESTKKRILVLEEDQTILEIIATALSHVGFEVETTQSNEVAYDWYLRRGPYDLVMAGLLSAKGMTLLTRIRNVCPSQPVAILTGCSSGEIVYELELLNIPVLLKPFSPLDELRTFVKEQLSNTPGQFSKKRYQ
jgi:DNA-binding response OmpR family regulator